MKHLRFSKIFNLWRFSLYLSFTTNLWGGSSENDRTEYTYFIAMKWNKVITEGKPNQYFISFVFLPIAIWFGYKVGEL